MKKWFRRQPLEVQVTHHGLVVEHQIRKMPDPRPIMAWLTITDRIGREFRTEPVHLNGRGGYRQAIPVEWLTGDTSDHGQVQFRVELSYE